MMQLIHLGIFLLMMIFCLTSCSQSKQSVSNGTELKKIASPTPTPYRANGITTSSTMVAPITEAKFHGK